MKIAILLPAHGYAHAWFAWALGRMIARTQKDRPELEIELFSQLGTLPRTRNRLFRDAIQWQADFALWLDNDHVFPPEALLRLLSLNLPVVGINQPTRSLTPRPTTHDEAGKPIYTSEEQAEAREVQQVRHMGLGICLINMAIVPALAGGARKSLFPLFEINASPDPDKIVGEDTWFCQRLTDAGIPIHIDHWLSWHTRHIAQVPIGLDMVRPPGDGSD